jgi:hypothetical protein
LLFSCIIACCISKALLQLLLCWRLWQYRLLYQLLLLLLLLYQLLLLLYQLRLLLYQLLLNQLWLYRLQLLGRLLLLLLQKGHGLWLCWCSGGRFN